MAKNNYQREGTTNAHAGKLFENKIYDFMRKNGISLDNQKQKKVKIGINSKKDHAFDFGNDNILIECKSQTWTKSGNVPSAKIKNWSDAMFSFYLSPEKYIKLFFVEKSYNQKNDKTLLEYFIEHYSYLIPEDVILIDYGTEDDYEIYTYDPKSKTHKHNTKKLWEYLKRSNG